MKSFLKQTLIILFSVIVVIASGGFSVFHHYCACTENLNYSILVEKTDCNDEGSEHHCAIKQETEISTCCQQKNSETLTDQKDCEKGDDCCSSEFFYFKTDNFDISGKNRVNFDFVVAYFAEVNDYQNQTPQSEVFIQLIDYDLPPPDYGKKLLFSLHQLKIATPLA